MGARNNRQKRRQQMLKVKVLWMLVAFVATIVILVTGTKLIWGNDINKEMDNVVDIPNSDETGEHSLNGDYSDEEVKTGNSQQVQIDQTDISGTIDQEDTPENGVPEDVKQGDMTEKDGPESDLPIAEKPEEQQNPTEEDANKTEDEVTVGEEKMYLALTFDDGPFPDVTNRILDVLEKNGAKATFFVMGNRLETYGDTYKEAVKRAYSLGCQIGNHTYSHKDLTKLSAADIKKEVEQSNELINAIVPVGDSLLRPPYGARNDTVYSTVKVPMITWSVDTEDWKSKNRDKIVKNILDTVSDGDIVLMHDLYSSTADAIEVVVPKLIEMGYELVTVNELFEAKDVALNPGSLYRKPASDKKTADKPDGADKATASGKAAETDKAATE